MRLNKDDIRTELESYVFNGNRRIILLTEYKNSSTNMNIIDTDGYMYSQTLSNIRKRFKTGTYFNRTKKNPFAEYNAKLFCNNNYPDIEFIRLEYRQHLENKDKFFTRVITKCKCGKENDHDLAMFNKNYKCARCSGTEKYTIERLLIMFDKRGYDLVSTEYIDAHHHLEYICRKHKDKGTLTISNTSFVSGNGCVYCGYESTRQHNSSKNEFYADFEKISNKEEFILKTEFKNQNEKMEIYHVKCNKNFKLTPRGILKGKKIYCPHCMDKRRENSTNWKGGISEINKHMRNAIKQWKKDSMLDCSYKCVLTGESFDVIHHRYSFDMIVSELFENLNIDIKEKMCDYSKLELISIEEECLKLHKKYGLGVCLSESVHKLYHHVYGYGQNTIDQWTQFEKDFKDGKYIKGIDY